MKHLKKAILWLKKTIPKIVDDILLLAGGGCIAIGSFLIYPPAGWIVTGILLLCYAYLLVQATAPRGSDGV